MRASSVSFESGAEQRSQASRISSGMAQILSFVDFHIIAARRNVPETALARPAKSRDSLKAFPDPSMPKQPPVKPQLIALILVLAVVGIFAASIAIGVAVIQAERAAQAQSNDQ
jgi:hypothetical protein